MSSKYFVEDKLTSSAPLVGDCKCAAYLSRDRRRKLTGSAPLVGDCKAKVAKSLLLAYCG